MDVPWRLVFLAVAATVALIGLVPLAVRALTREVPAPGGQLIEGVVGQPTSLNPLRLRTDVDRDLAALLFNGLTRLSTTGEPEPDLATGWRRADDGLSYTFTLRPDLRWHDGQPVTSRDVVFTVQALASSPDGAADAAPLAGVQAEAVDPLTVRLSTDRPRPELPRLLARPIAPAHRLEGRPPAELEAAEDSVRPIGTGPFRVVESTLDRVTMERNPTYHAGQPFLERYVVRFFPDAAAARAAFGRAEVDALWLRASADDPAAGHAWVVPVWNELTLLWFNTRSGPLADPALRRALTAAVDPASLAKTALPERFEPARGPLLPPQAPAGLNLAGDAAGQLDRLGWIAGGDGQRARAGLPLQFELAASESGESTALARTLAERLRGVGVDIVSTTLPWARLARDRLAPARFELAVAALRGTADDAGLRALWGADAAADLNLSGWRSERLDAALAALPAAGNPAELAAARTALLAAFADELPAVPLAWPRYRFLAPPELQGMQLDSLLATGQRYRDVQDWYVQTARTWRFLPGSGG